MTIHLSQSQKSNFQMAIMLTFGEVPNYSNLTAFGKEIFRFNIETAEWELTWDDELGRWIAICIKKIVGEILLYSNETRQIRTVGRVIENTSYGEITYRLEDPRDFPYEVYPRSGFKSETEAGEGFCEAGFESGYSPAPKLRQAIIHPQEIHCTYFGLMTEDSQTESIFYAQADKESAE